MNYPFPLLPGFSFGKKPPSYPLEGSSHVTRQVLTSGRYGKRRDKLDSAVMTDNLIVLFRVLAFYIDLKDRPDFWANVSNGWSVTNTPNTRQIAEFYSDRHIDWTNAQVLKRRIFTPRETLLIHLVGYWCENRHKELRQPHFNGLDLWSAMDAEWRELRDAKRAILFNEMRAASLRPWAPALPRLTISSSYSAQLDETRPRQFSGAQQSGGGSRAGSGWGPPFKRNYPESGRLPQHLGSYSASGRPPAFDPSHRGTEGPERYGGTYSEPGRERGRSQHCAERHVMSGALEPPNASPSQMESGGSQLLELSYMPSSVPQTATTNVRGVQNNAQHCTPKRTQTKRHVPVSVQQSEERASSPLLGASDTSNSGSNSDAESEASESESETEVSSEYQDTGSGAERGALTKMKKNETPRRVTRSQSANSSASSSASGDTSSSDSNSNSSSDSDSSATDNDSESEPELPSPKKPTKAPVKNSTKGKQKTRAPLQESADVQIKSEPDLDSCLPSVPIAQTEQQPPTSAQKPPSVPPAKRTEKSKTNARPAKRRRGADDEAEKQAAAEQPPTKKQAAVKGKTRASDKAKASKAQHPVKAPPVKDSASKASATTPRGKGNIKEGIAAISDNIKKEQLNLERAERPPLPPNIEQNRTIDMLFQRVDTLEEQLKESERYTRRLYDHIDKTEETNAKKLADMYGHISGLLEVVSEPFSKNPKATNSAKSTPAVRKKQ